MSSSGDRIALAVGLRTRPFPRKETRKKEECCLLREGGVPRMDLRTHCVCLKDVKQILVIGYLEGLSENVKYESTFIYVFIFV